MLSPVPPDGKMIAAIITLMLSYLLSRQTRTHLPLLQSEDRTGSRDGGRANGVGGLGDGSYRECKHITALCTPLSGGGRWRAGRPPAPFPPRQEARRRDFLSSF